jgi:hypothetical protein
LEGTLSGAAPSVAMLIAIVILAMRMCSAEQCCSLLPSALAKMQ